MICFECRILSKSHRGFLYPLANQKGVLCLYIQADNNTKRTQVATNAGKVLVDKDRNGKERPWRAKKLSNVSYYEILEILSFKKAERVSSCGEILEYDVDNEGNMKLAKAWFCKSSLCPMCNWRKAMKHSEQAKRVVFEAIKRRPTARWLFLRLSVRNAIDGESLDTSLKLMAEGFRRLMMYKKVTKNLIGFMRTTEITVNQEDGSYNQHMHILLCVKSTYFKDKANYIEQEEWASLWQKAMKLPYVPNVHIEAVKDKRISRKTGKEKDGLIGAIYETAKYAVKDADYLTGNVQNDIEYVRDLEQGLHRKRLISYGGLLKEIHKELNLEDVEESDLIHTDDEKEIQEKAYSLVAQWNWKQQNYFIRE